MQKKGGQQLRGFKHGRFISQLNLIRKCINDFIVTIFFRHYNSIEIVTFVCPPGEQSLHTMRFPFNFNTYRIGKIIIFCLNLFIIPFDSNCLRDPHILIGESGAKRVTREKQNFPIIFISHCEVKLNRRPWSIDGGILVILKG